MRKTPGCSSLNLIASCVVLLMAGCDDKLSENSATPAKQEVNAKEQRDSKSTREKASQASPDNKTAKTRSTAESFVQHVPTTAYQAQQIIDLTKVPRLQPTADYRELDLIANDFTSLYYESEKSMTEIGNFYAKHFAERGWDEIPDPYADKFPKSLAMLWFTKQRLLLRITIQQEGANGSSANLELAGDIDARQIPVPEDATEVAATIGSTIHKTSLTPERIRAFYNKNLVERGWQRHRDEKNKSYDFKREGLLYRRNAMLIRVRPDSNSLQIYPSLLRYDLPALPNATDLLLQSQSSFYITATPILEVVEYYEKTLPPLGWKQRTEMQEEFSKTFAQLFFERANGEGMIVNVVKDKENSRVELSILKPEKLGELAVHRALLKKAPNTYLVVENAHTVTLNQHFNELNYRIPMTAKQLVGYYTETLQKRGWQFVFDPEVSDSEAKLWLEQEDEKFDDLHIKVTPYGADESEVVVTGDLQALIDAE